MKKLILALILGLSLQSASAQQDAQFSQYLFNGLYINPAYAGYKEALNIHGYYRNQWTSVDGAPVTGGATVDASFNDGNVGLALNFSNDRLGLQRGNFAQLNYAYRIRFDAAGDTRLAFGVSGGFGQFGIDYTQAVTNTQDPLMGSGVARVLVPDARAGVYFSSPRFFAGVSADNLISSQYRAEKFRNVTRPVVHGYLTAGGLVPVSTDVALRPSFLIKEDFHGPTSLDLNAFILFGEKLWLGGSYRTSMKLWTKDNLESGLQRPASAVAMAEVFPTRNLRIGYGYDFALGPLKGYAGGSHEISVYYIFGRKDSRMNTPRVF